MYSALLLLFVLLVTAEKTSLVWLCLERCPGFDFESDLKMLALHKKAISLVSYENWQIDANGHLQFATHNGVPVSDVGSKIAAAGFSLYPMLTSGDINAMRALFAAPEKLITDAIDVAKRNKYIGYHIDFEPATGAVPGDAVLYATFVDTFSKALHKEGLILGIDVATWSPVWNFSLLGKTSVDKIYTMATYTNNITRLYNEVVHLVSQVGPEKAAIAFDSDITTVDTLPHLIPILRRNQVNAIGLWRDNQKVSVQWFSFMSEFLKF